MKKNLGVVLSILVLLGVAAAGYKSWADKRASQLNHASSSPITNLLKSSISSLQAKGQTLRLLTGSAKFNFLKDPAVIDILNKEGIALELVKSESFEQDQLKLPELDAVWPAGANVAADWNALIPDAGTYPVLFTPLALASWKVLMPVFEKNGLAKMSGPGHADFYLEKALPLMLKDTRWNQLQNNEVFNVNKSFLVNTPNLQKSNTGTLFIAMLAYIQNGNAVVQDNATAEAITAKLASLITRQGFQEATLAGPFEDYIGQGIGKAPLVLIYESQFIEAKRAGKLRDAHLLLYPQPGLVVKHILVAKSPLGKKLGELLMSNKEIQKIAAQYGFRTNDPAAFLAETKTLGLDAPELPNLAEVPSAKIMEVMNQSLIKKMEGQ